MILPTVTRSNVSDTRCTDVNAENEMRIELMGL
jgi:hypothetical protein